MVLAAVINEEHATVAGYFPERGKLNDYRPHPPARFNEDFLLIVARDDYCQLDGTAHTVLLTMGMDSSKPSCLKATEHLSSSHWISYTSDEQEKELCFQQNRKDSTKHRVTACYNPTSIRALFSPPRATVFPCQPIDGGKDLRPGIAWQQGGELIQLAGAAPSELVVDGQFDPTRKRDPVLPTARRE